MVKMFLFLVISCDSLDVTKREDTVGCFVLFGTDCVCVFVCVCVCIQCYIRLSKSIIMGCF